MLQKNFDKLVIPAQKYCKFTTEPDVIPEVLISAWQEIGQKDSEEFQGDRTFIADFEVYDNRAIDTDNTVLDICIGIK